MAPRSERPECWGPLTPSDLLRKLAAHYNWDCSKSAQWGMHPSPAALIAWQELKKDYSAGRPLRAHLLPFHAQRITERIQTVQDTSSW